jgi:hypothetical protein
MYKNGEAYLPSLQINVVTQRGFVPVDERMRVMDADGNVVCCKFCDTFFLENK